MYFLFLWGSRLHNRYSIYVGISLLLAFSLVLFFYRNRKIQPLVYFTTQIALAPVIYTSLGFFDPIRWNVSYSGPDPRVPFKWAMIAMASLFAVSLLGLFLYRQRNQERKSWPLTEQAKKRWHYFSLFLSYGFVSYGLGSMGFGVPQWFLLGALFTCAFAFWIYFRVTQREESEELQHQLPSTM